ncbi:DNA polymerase ligase N-terminal domain-containing protein [Caballeronia sp. S22]|uniref:DNA polymerase ligase N-terminal domain-containing protein n=1 Tax=Caballeronia sp. S22 TaxID=3137182 RepID=UPI003530CC1E
MASPRDTTAPPLARYRKKRDFSITPEPSASTAETSNRARQLGFVVQKHWASRLHYDFRLELNGVLLSWAVPKGPCYDPSKKQMAVHVEDHPLSYASFEGTIPPKQYGAGTVIVWDHGTWEPVGDAVKGMEIGKLVFRLHGQKLAGLWELVRIAKPDDKQDQWMLFKKRDEWAPRFKNTTLSRRFPTASLHVLWGRLKNASRERRDVLVLENRRSTRSTCPPRCRHRFQRNSSRSWRHWRVRFPAPATG